ncbi:MAG: metallophosphoesterase, partial [Bacteroidota bacterium]
MKKTAIAFLPLLFAGFILPDDSCRQNTIPMASNVSQNDGPYVLYRNDKIYVKYILENKGVNTAKQDSMALTEKGNISLTVQTDEPDKTFTVKLKSQSQLQNEEAEFANVNKLFILSDIEGNFRAFRKLLQANKVIDQNFNWTFGKGHLVLTGDFFDRGDQVTEVLWLIYSLEEKAKAAGGYVHFVLGNHEIMNLSGDIRYVVPKYFQNAALINENYMSLFSENSELGRWLRTKNIMEKVGDILFMHGGISGAVNSMNIPVSELSNLARPFYADSTYKYNNA